MAPVFIVLIHFITWSTTGALLTSSPNDRNPTYAQPQQLTVPNSAKLFYDFSSGQFIATYYIGNLVTKVHTFIDSKSDVIWTNSKSKDGFSYSKSTQVRCDDRRCQQLGRNKICTNGPSPCTYSLTYVDRDGTSAVLSTDTFWFDSPTQSSSPQKVGPLYFGCSSKVNKGFSGEDINGCLGLNRGKLSLSS